MSSLPYWALFLTNDGWCISNQPFHPIEPLILIGPLIWLRNRGARVGYQVCFSLFFFYLWGVCNYAICPLPINADLIEWMSTVQTWDNRINLKPHLLLDLPFYWRDADVFLNVVLGIPFGLGLPFVVTRTNRAAKRAIAIHLAFAASLELIQLGISCTFYGFPYRSIDIEDVVFVFVGALVGETIYRMSTVIYRRIGWQGGARIPVWNHFHDVLRGNESIACTESNA